MKNILAILLLSLAAAAQTGQVNHGGTGLNASANNSVLVGTGPGTYTLVAVPDCQDVNGNHLNYTSGSYTINCGTSSGVSTGTPFQVTRYNAAGNALQDSTGSDNPANGASRWTNGLSVESNAGYRMFSNSPAGTAINLLACADASVTTVTQVTTCTAASSKSFGIIDTGAGTSGNSRIAMIGFHACVFDDQTAVNDYVAPSATNDGQCSDVGGSKPNNVQIIGKVTTVNSGAGTLATVDLFTGDTVAPGSSGGSGTVSNSCTGVTYYPSPGTTVVGDCLFLTDGAGHITMYSLGLLDSTYAGFMYDKQGPLPPAAPANSIMEFAPTSVTTYSIQKASAAGTAGQCWQVIGTATDANSNTIDQMGWGSCSGGGGGGSVTNFSAGNLSPLFTTSVANATTVPALSFALSNAAANTIFGNFTGSSGAASYNAISACGDSTHALKYVAATGFGCQAISSGASSVGLSVNGGSSSGIFAVTGSPVTSSGTLNTNLSGTSGGVPYFSSSSVLSSSGALTSNNPVLGGGAGGTPTSGTRSGNTTTFATTTGSLTNGDIAKFDASGNVIDGGSAPTSGGSCSTTPGFCAYFPNDTVTGTLNNTPAKWLSYGINQQKIVKAGNTDYLLGWQQNTIGIVQTGGGTSGSAEVCYAGRCTCQFDNAATAGSFVALGTTGICSASSTAGVNENPDTNKFFAKVHTTIGAPGNTDIDMLPVGSYSLPACCGTNGTASRFTLGTAGVSSLTGGPLFLDTTWPATTQQPLIGTIGGFLAYAPSDLSRAALWTAEAGLTVTGAPAFNGMAIHMDNSAGMAPKFGWSVAVGCFHGSSCQNADTSAGASASIFSYPDVVPVLNTTVLEVPDTLADSHKWTIAGNSETFITAATIQPGHVVRYTLVQDGTGGHSYIWPLEMVNPPTVNALPNGTTTADFWAADTTHYYCIAGCTGPIREVKTSQVAALSTTTLAKPVANSTYRVSASLSCDSSSAAATVNVTISWTDPSNTAQTTTLGSAVVCTALGASSIGDLTKTFRAKSGTSITYSTAIVNTPTYDLAISLETLTAN